MNFDDTFDLNELVDNIEDLGHSAPSDDVDYETLYADVEG